MFVSVAVGNTMCWEMINKGFQLVRQGNFRQIEEKMWKRIDSKVLRELDDGSWVGLKPSIKEPPDLELKTLPTHLEYAYLEADE